MSIEITNESLEDVDTARVLKLASFVRGELKLHELVELGVQAD